MKKLLIFFIIFVLFACESPQNKDAKTSLIKCPAVFFSSENNVYSYGKLENLNLDEIEYIATLNNYALSSGCIVDSNIYKYSLDLLILIEFLKPVGKEVNLPIFVLVYDKNEILIDKQYFRIKENFTNILKKTDQKKSELKTKLNILVTEGVEVGSITIGFVKIKNSN